MSVLRRLAIAISATTVRKAPRRSREWAEGLAREVEFIESDWRALVWAIGSRRIMLLKPPMPLGTPAEIARAGRIYAGNREHMPPIGAWIMVVQALASGLRVVFPIGHAGPLQRMGFAVAAVCAAYIGLVSWQVTRLEPRPDDMEDDAWIGFYRHELVRLQQLFSGFGAFFRGAMVMFLAGASLGLHGPAWHAPAFFLIAFSMHLARLMGDPAEGYQRKIDQLDSALKQGGVSQ